jgi:hypothetical protein
MSQHFFLNQMGETCPFRIISFAKHYPKAGQQPPHGTCLVGGFQPAEKMCRFKSSQARLNARKQFESTNNLYKLFHVEVSGSNLSKEPQ